MGSSIALRRPDLVQTLQRLLRPFAQIREDEIFATILMFSYSFLAMSAYNIIQPVQRSLFIEKLGASKVPCAQLAAGIAIGLITSGYAWLVSRLPRRWALPITQAGIALVLLSFWALFSTQPDQKWVAVGLYLLGFILAILLISQFWTLANVVYDPRQAKRLFGFIGGGATLGGTIGAFITWFAKEIGSVNLLLIKSEERGPRQAETEWKWKVLNYRIGNNVHKQAEMGRKLGTRFVTPML